jgi:hypothetical protein
MRQKKHEKIKFDFIHFEVNTKMEYLLAYLYYELDARTRIFDAEKVLFLF